MRCPEDGRMAYQLNQQYINVIYNQMFDGGYNVGNQRSVCV